MARCSICDHPQRHLIEAALHAGTPQRQLAVQFGVGKSTLGRHTAHVVWPSADAPAPPATARPFPSVRQAQERLTQVEAHRETVQDELATAREQLTQTQAAVRLARWKEDPVRLRQAEETLTRVQQQVEDLRAAVVGLEEARRQAAWELAQAQARRTQQDTQHWLTVVLPQLEDPFDLYCCRLLARESRVPPTTPAATLQRLGPMGTSQLRVATCQRLREQYPFVEEEPVHA